MELNSILSKTNFILSGTIQLMQESHHLISIAKKTSSFAISLFVVGVYPWIGIPCAVIGFSINMLQLTGDEGKDLINKVHHIWEMANAEIYAYLSLILCAMFSLTICFVIITTASSFVLAETLNKQPA